MGKMTLEDNINCIKEIFPGQYRIILDFATKGFLNHLIQDTHQYIWVHNHSLEKHEQWKNLNLPIQEGVDNLSVLAKSVTFDFIIPTKEFKSLIPTWKGGVELLQINRLPPSYLNLFRIKGKKRYELLQKECDYLFEVEIPTATDYGLLVSSNRDYLQALLDNPKIDWQDLP